MTTNTDLEVSKIIQSLSGGEGSDHFSPSQLALPIPKWIINYFACTQAMRRQSVASYKMHFGNLTNNTAQRLVSKYIFMGDKRLEIQNRNLDEVFKDELAEIDKQEVRDEKDKWSREAMIELAKPCIQKTLEALKEIFKDDELQSERYVHDTPEGLYLDILGRVDYESNKAFAEMKSKPPYVRQTRNGFSMFTQKVPLEPDDNHIAQVSFYYAATKKTPHLFYVSDKEYIIFDSSHEKLRPEYLEYAYEQLVKKAFTIQRLLLLSGGKAEEMAKYVEPPDFNHPYYYKDLTEEQKQIIKNLWGII